MPTLRFLLLGTAALLLMGCVPGTLITPLDITCRFESPDGRPLAGLPVKIYRQARINGHTGTLTYGNQETVTTDAQGTFLHRTGDSHEALGFAGIVLGRRVKRPPFTLALSFPDSPDPGAVTFITAHPRRTRIDPFHWTTGGDIAPWPADPPGFRAESRLERTGEGWNVQITLRSIR